MSQGRADTIARTATTEGSSFASVEGYRQAGVEEKEWLTTVSGDSRASHVAMDGQIVGITENFESGDGGTAPYPGGFGDPSEDCNCECAVLPVVSEKRLSSRAMILKAFERLRAPHRRAMRSAMGKAFAAQSDAVVAAIREYDDVAEAA
jgi:uncharacterized protein with gpF-like domain